MSSSNVRPRVLAASDQPAVRLREPLVVAAPCSLGCGLSGLLTLRAADNRAPTTLITSG